MTPLFVTGTDTGVGKTHVTRGVIRLLMTAGFRVAPLKLIETGCSWDRCRLVPADGARLAAAARLTHALEIVSPERFALAAAPSTAARVEGREIRFESLHAHVRAAQALGDVLVLEGAGGALVPIGPDGSFADFAASLHARPVIVARDALGTLNHTLLTLEALAHRGLTRPIVVLNAVGPQRSPLDHADELRRLVPALSIVGPLAWAPESDDDGIAAALAAAGLRAGDLT